MKQENIINNYEEKLKKERQWHIFSGFRANHFLNSKLFYSTERHLFNYTFLKGQMVKFLEQVIQSNKIYQPRMLIAPIGNGDDLKYIRHISNDISGIDISKEAISKIFNEQVRTYVGDIKNMDMFPDDYFDVVIMPLFFHHFIKFGFSEFLKESFRVLRSGGVFISLEPSLLSPVSWLSWLIRKIFGNVSGLIEDERPLSPFQLSGAMKKCGFRDIKVLGASFAHNRFPIWFAKFVNIISTPLLRFPVIKYFAWMCLFYGKK